MLHLYNKKFSTTSTLESSSFLLWHRYTEKTHQTDYLHPIILYYNALVLQVFYPINNRSCACHSDSLWSCWTFQTIVPRQSIRLSCRQNGFSQSEVDGNGQQERRLTNALNIREYSVKHTSMVIWCITFLK